MGEIERLQGELRTAHARIDALPPILTMEEIQAQLGPLGQYPLPTVGLLPTDANTDPPEIPPIDDGIPNYIDIVTAAHDSMGIGPASTAEEVFNFMRQVAADINASGTVPSGLVCGFVLAPPAGDNVFTCSGETYRYNRVAFSNGHLFKILIDSDPGGARTPDWTSNGMSPTLYAPATSPGSPC